MTQAFNTELRRSNETLGPESKNFSSVIRPAALVFFLQILQGNRTPKHQVRTKINRNTKFNRVFAA